MTQDRDPHDESLSKINGFVLMVAATIAALIGWMAYNGSFR